MNTDQILHELETEGLLTSKQRSTLGEYQKYEPVSVFLQIRTLLYLSITGIIAGLGIIIYENINTIGHAVLLVILSISTLTCFGYAFKTGSTYTSNRVSQPTPYFDTVLLLGCLLFLVVEAYAQYQFNIFGTRYGLASLLPAILFLYLAYRFDHQGVLSLGLSSLASWVGLTIAPDEILVKNEFADTAVILTSLLFGSIVLVISKVLEIQKIKPHFNFTYLLIAGTLYLIASTAGMITFHSWKFIYALFSGIGCWYFYFNAREGESLLFLLIALMFGYIVVTYLLFHQLSLEFGAFLGSMYFLLSAAGVVWFLLNYKKILGRPV